MYGSDAPMRRTESIQFYFYSLESLSQNEEKKGGEWGIAK
jgi:hypothetical protein